MAKTLSDIESKALKLPAKKRAALAGKLLDSLGTKRWTENEVLWAREAQRRYEAMVSGKTKGIPAEKVFKELRTKFR